MIRIALVDDHAALRQGLRDYLATCPDLRVVAEGSNGAQALRIAVEDRPDVLVMDLAMPGQNGLAALAALRERAPAVRVLILSGYPEEFHAPQLLRQGAAGNLHKHCAPEDIEQAIRRVAGGGRWLTPQTERLMAAQPPLTPVAGAAA